MVPRVSVVISSYNRSASVVHAVASLAAQRTPLPFEVIVVDNNSTDDTRAAVNRAIARFATIPVRYAFEPRQGVSHGRNRGIAEARAPIVAFTDDDVEVRDDWVQTIAEALDAHPEIDCVGGPVLPRWTVPPPPWLTRRHWAPLALVEYGPDPLYIDAERPLCLLTANVAYRRATLDRIGYFSPEFPRCQDHELLLRLWRHGGRCLYLPSLVVESEVPESRMTWSYHRTWHTRHGYYCARMGDGAAGPHCGPLRGASPALFGSAGALYAELFGSLKAFAWSVLTRNAARRLESDARARHLASFIKTRRALWRASRPRGTLAEIAAFALAWTRIYLDTAQATRPRLSLTERVPAYALAAIVIGGSAYDIVRDQEHWPFSQYPMFSTVERSRTFESLRLFGVMADGRSEVPLLAHDYLEPLDQCRLSTSLSWIARMPDGPAMLEDIVRRSFRRYEARRARGEHDGPELAAVRLYRCRWNLRHDASNSETPDFRELVLAVDAGGTAERRAGAAP